MHKKTPPTHKKPQQAETIAALTVSAQTKAKESQAGLSTWLNNTAFQQYLGPTTIFKIDLLLTLLIHGNVAECARRYGRTRQAAYVAQRRLKELLLIPR